MSDFRWKPTWAIPPDVFQNRISDLERQLAAASTQITDLLALKEGLVSGQLELQRQLAEKKAEIEAMRPIVDFADGLCRGEDWNNGTHAKAYRHKLRKAVREYIERKQP